MAFRYDFRTGTERYPSTFFDIQKILQFDIRNDDLYNIAIGQPDHRREHTVNGDRSRKRDTIVMGLANVIGTALRIINSPWLNRIFARSVQVILTPIVRWTFHLQIEGVENLPKTGAYILAGWHSSDLDPIIMTIASGRKVSTVSYIVKRQRFTAKNGIRYLFERVFKCIPISQEAAREALARGEAALGNGDVLGIFPTGTRTGASDVQDGTAVIGIRTQKLIIPLRVFGADQAWPHTARFIKRIVPLRVAVGKPIVTEGLTSADIPEITSRLRESLNALS